MAKHGFWGAAVRLKQVVEAQLLQCSKEASDTQLTIVSKPRSGSVCVLTYLTSVKLVPEFIAIYSEIFQPISNYKKGQILTLKDFIDAHGGLNSTVSSFGERLKVLVVLMPNDAGVDYSDRLFMCCKDALNLTVRYEQRKSVKKTKPPFCALCWRRVDQSKFYCELHHSEQSNSKYKQHKESLFRSIKNTNSKYLDELNSCDLSRRNSQLPLFIFKWVSSFAEDPSKINMQFPDINFLNLESWKKTASYIISFCHSKYPFTYSKIAHVAPEKFGDWKLWCYEIICCLDSTESSFWKANDDDQWLEFENKIPGGLTLLSMLQRYEATEFLRALPRRSGPKKGKVLTKNIALREKIRCIVKDLRSKSEKINKSAIGRQLSISRNRVNVIMKELELEGLIN